MRKQEIEEGLGELADIAERDHEVQMARADLYKSAKYAIKLHEMLKGVSEAEGLEGWVQSKITKASEMLGSVYHHMDYEESGLADEAMVVGESQRDTHCSDKCCGADVKREDCGCSADCEHCNCNDTSIPEGSYGKKKKKSTNEKSVSEGPFKGVGKALMKRKLNKQYKKSDLANFDKSGLDTSGKTPDEIGQMKSDYYHDHMDKADRAKKAGDRLSRKKESISYKEQLHLKLEGKKKFKSAAHRKAVHAAKASGKR